jgi:hypothetical protein
VKTVIKSKTNIMQRKYKLESPFSDKFAPNWQTWLDYKKTEHRFTYKSPISEQAALNMLVDLSEGDEEHAVRIMNQSMANGWKGFFKIHNPKKDQKNGESTTKKAAGGASIDELKVAYSKRTGTQG